MPLPSTRRFNWTHRIVLLMVFLCAGAWIASSIRSMRDRAEVAEITMTKKTVCVGRYLVDVPAKAAVSLSGSMLDGFDIARVEESEAAFRERVAAREAEIRASHGDPATNTEGGMVEARDLRIPGIVGRTLVYGRSRSYLMEGDRRIYSESVSVESHAHLDGVSFSLSDDTAKEEAAAEAETLLARIQPLGADEIPAAPGFCIARAVFVDPLPAHSNEHIVMHLELPQHPDLGLNLASFAGARPGASLLARTAQTDASTNPDVRLRMTKLRERKRNINGVDGEELLLRAREYNFTTTYGFDWEAPGKTDNPSLPFLSLALRTGINERPGGKPVHTSLHEDALLALWDGISSSIRLRKPDFSHDAGPPGTAASPTSRHLAAH
jgi:hypothetical protein